MNIQSPSLRIISAAAAVAALAGAPAAYATWSIILIDMRTREIAAGSATCLTTFDLQAGTPVILTGVGAATAQSFVDSTGQNRVFIRDKLALGVAPADIITGLATFDTGHQTRQYGIVDVLGRTATFSGTGGNQWAGGQTGQFQNVHLGQTGTIAYAIQGNILTGQCVVDAAVLAAINEPGDLPQKLMKAMQAARVTGGDGRCSCPANPTSCGCPPATFTKSAHIAYMLIARTGDTDGYFGIYRTGSGPWAVTSRDLTGDGRPELLVTNTSSSNFSVLANITPAGNAFGMFALPTNYVTGAAPRSIALGDITGDSIEDVVTGNLTANTVSVIPGTGGGAFGAKTDYQAGLGIFAIGLADLDGVNGRDVVVTNSTADLFTVLRNNGAGGLLPAVQYAAGDDPRELATLNLDGNATLDLVVAVRNQGKLTTHMGNGDGTFTPGPDIPTPANPTVLASGDFDGDTDIDLAVGCQTGTGVVAVLINNAGTFTLTQHALAASPNGIGAGDVTGDGRRDLLVSMGNQRFVVLTGSAGGAFTLGTPFLTGQSLFDVELADFNQDGALDAAFPNLSGSLIVADNQGGGVFSDGIGTGSGDYFMTFNVPNQPAGNPDPVAQLQTTFDAWRTALVARPDGVQSLTSVSPASISANGSSTSDLVFTLRDWQGSLVTTPMQSISVTHAPGSAGQSSIGPVQNLGNGEYRVVLTAGTIPGVDRFRVEIDDGQRPVSLMPDPALTLDDTCYPDCNGVGGLTIADFGCFRTRFVAQDPYADCTGTNGLTIADWGCFQTKFVAGCP
jgi:Family of unknown function (DUF1028)/Invasin, domain 3/FG-GAP-like repeat